jgi:hypothetical protein
MCAFQCDSCFHNQVCSDEPNTRALNEECALYANVKKFTDTQQLKAKIAAIAETVHLMAHNQVCDKDSLIFVRDKLRQLSAV